MNSRLWICVMLAGLVLSLGGCLKDEIGGVMVKENTATDLLCVAESGGVVSFYASGRWTASTSVPWLSVDPQEGQGGELLQVLTVKTTEMNRTGEIRSAVVMISSGGKEEPVEVRQRGEYAVFDEHEIILPADGGPVDVGFRTNVPSGQLHLYCTTVMKDWIKVEKTRQELQGNLNYVVLLPNDGQEMRDGYLYLVIETEGDHPQRLELDALHVIQEGRGYDD